MVAHHLGAVGHSYSTVCTHNPRKRVWSGREAGDTHPRTRDTEVSGQAEGGRQTNRQTVPASLPEGLCLPEGLVSFLGPPYSKAFSLAQANSSPNLSPTSPHLSPATLGGFSKTPVLPKASCSGSRPEGGQKPRQPHV